MLYVEKEQIMRGKYYSFCTDILGKQYQQWLVPARILGASPAEYVKMLVKANATIWYSTKHNIILGHYWENQADERKWKNYINKIAREKNFQI